MMKNLVQMKRRGETLVNDLVGRLKWAGDFGTPVDVSDPIEHITQAARWKIGRAHV